jgi:acetylornithine deacetylase/succinyl-diaminopimelate desuccinylase-like protein
MPPPLVLSAHLDTVFPAGTDVALRREGPRILAPGISDDGRGLAALLALARVLTETGVPVTRPLLFLASVGEEGAGNLRGVRHFFSSRSWNPPPFGFISLDGVGLDRIIHRGVGSLRLRVTARGPGGHSWTDFGKPNPIHLLGVIVAGFQKLQLGKAPRSTLTVARWGGGTSINSIPVEAWIEVDLRSESEDELVHLERQVSAILGAGRDTTVVPGALDEPDLAVQEIGRRPAGITDPSAPLVQKAVEATRILGESPELAGSSTDANLPMSLGIPAITVGAGGAGGRVHTPGEWYENRKGPEGIFRALLTIVLLEE